MMSESKTMSNSDIQQAIDINDLSYIADNSSNLIVQRNQKKMYADSSSNSTANNRNIIINMQTGNDYISFKDSYLRLKINVKKADGSSIAILGPAWGPKGSVLNIFDNIKVITRGGTELSHDSRANLLNYYRVLYETSETWKETQQGKGLIGYRQPIVKVEDGKTNEYMIPLSLLNSFFNQDQLTPNNVCRGLRLEMTLSDQIGKMLFLQGGSSTVDNPTEIVVSDCELLLDSYRIDPRAQTILNEMSASETGLVLQYYDYERVGHDKPLGATSSSFEMRKTVSMANACFAVLRATLRDDSEGKRELDLDSFASVTPTAAHKYHWRLGSTYFPVNKIEGLTQWFAQNVYCSDKLRSGEEFGMQYQDRYVTVPASEYKGDPVDFIKGQSSATACVNIDRHFLDLSGLAINNSTTLNLLIDTPVNALQIDMFLKHTVRAVAFLETVSVKK